MHCWFKVDWARWFRSSSSTLRPPHFRAQSNLPRPRLKKLRAIHSGILNFYRIDLVNWSLRKGLFILFAAFAKKKLKVAGRRLAWRDRAPRLRARRASRLRCHRQALRRALQRRRRHVLWSDGPLSWNRFTSNSAELLLRHMISIAIQLVYYEYQLRRASFLSDVCSVFQFSQYMRF